MSRSVPLDTVGSLHESYVSYASLGIAASSCASRGRIARCVSSELVASSERLLVVLDAEPHALKLIGAADELKVIGVIVLAEHLGYVVLNQVLEANLFVNEVRTEEPFDVLPVLATTSGRSLLQNPTLQN